MDRVEAEAIRLADAIIASQYCEETGDFLIKGKLDKKYARRFRARCQYADKINIYTEEKKTLPLTIEAQNKQVIALAKFSANDGRPERHS